MSIEKTLFAAADKMRGAMDAGEYKHVALGLLFLRYVSAAFEKMHEQLSADEYDDPEDPEEYIAENVFWVPEKARWSYLAGHAKDPRIGVMVDDAMRAIEADNSSLKGALPKVYGRESLDKSIVSGLIDLFTNLKLGGTGADFDLIGRIYEYFIGEFASNEGKRGGEASPAARSAWASPPCSIVARIVLRSLSSLVSFLSCSTRVLRRSKPHGVPRPASTIAW